MLIQRIWIFLTFERQNLQIRTEMSEREKQQSVKEEIELKGMFLRIMEGYNDSAIPPLSYFSRFQVDSISEKDKSSLANEEQRTSLILKDRKRREQMNQKFSVLLSMVPTLSKYSKLTKEDILNGTLNYIKYLEEEIKWLEGSIRRLTEPKAATPVFSRCANRSSPTNVSFSNEATFLAIQIPCRHGLLLEIVKVLEKHGVDVVEARVSVDDQRLLTFTATLMIGSNGDSTLQNLKKDVLSL